MPRRLSLRRWVAAAAVLMGGGPGLTATAQTTAERPAAATSEEAVQPGVDRRAFAFFPTIDPAAYPDTGYDQPHRPQFHFCSKRNWLNDPNGMVFDGRRFHLFFQHNPLGTEWGNMTWGHATSDDMVHWRQQDHALLPYMLGKQAGTIFSGTAVVDHNDSLGLQTGETKTLAAFFTFATKPRFYQAMAYSLDRGETWTYHNDGRPVVENQGFDAGERDPKVFWHEPSGQWVMVLWVQRAADAKDDRPATRGRVRIFTSDNLTDWEFASDLMRDWAYECMDVVFLPVDGDTDNVKCVFYDASFDYEVGEFDGTRFTNIEPTRKLGRGNFYAAQTFNSMPDSLGLPGDRPGRCVQIGWMQGGPNSADAYGTPHNQQMAFPCDLTLRTENDGLKLCAYPIPEIERIERDVTRFDRVDIAANAKPLQTPPLDLVDVSLTLEPGDAAVVTIDLPQVSLAYDAATGTLRVGPDAKQVLFTGMPPRDGRIDLRVLVDRLSVEAYAFGGEQFGALYIDPRTGPTTFPRLAATGGNAIATDVVVRRLNSIWPNADDAADD